MRWMESRGSVNYLAASPECDNIFNVSTSCLLLHKSPGNEFLMAENEPQEEIKEFFSFYKYDLKK